MLTGLAAAGVSAGAGLIGNLLGNKSQKDANKANLQINKMNNEFNERMLDKQNKWNLEQWDREVAYNDRVRAETNEYNSARAQVERYRQAGLNPAIMMQGQGAGTSQGGSAPQARSGSASAAPSAAMQAFRPDMSFVNPLAEVMFQANSMAEDVEYKRLQNLYTRETLATRLLEATERLKNSNLDRTLKQKYLYYFDDIMKGQMNLTDMQAKQADFNAQLLDIERQLALEELNHFSERFGNEQALLLAQKFATIANKNLTIQQKRTEVYNTAKAAYEAQGVRDSNRLASLMANDMIDNLKKTNDLLGKQTEMLPYSTFGNVSGNILGGALSGILGISAIKGWSKVPRMVVKGFR